MIDIFSKLIQFMLDTIETLITKKIVAGTALRESGMSPPLASDFLICRSLYGNDILPSDCAVAMYINLAQGSIPIPHVISQPCSQSLCAIIHRERRRWEYDDYVGGKEPR